MDIKPQDKRSLFKDEVPIAYNIKQSTDDKQQL